MAGKNILCEEWYESNVVNLDSLKMFSFISWCRLNDLIRDYHYNIIYNKHVLISYFWHSGNYFNSYVWTQDRIDIFARNTYTQWPAVIIQFSDRIEPPQWPLPCTRTATCQGQSCGTASAPPTIRVSCFRFCETTPHGGFAESHERVIFETASSWSYTLWTDRYFMSNLNCLTF